MSLDNQLNKHLVQIITPEKFKVYQGPIPETIPLITNQGRIVAGGNIIFNERRDALSSQNQERINAWGNNYYDLADASLTFEDLLKIQPDSYLLKGIQGIVNTNDGLMVAVDANAVKRSTKQRTWKYFQSQFSKQETVIFGTGNQEQKQGVEDIVLFHYDNDSIKLKADQFKAVKAQEIKRKDIVYGEDLQQEQVVKDGKVVHKVWQQYDPKVIVPFAEETFAFAGKEYNFDTNMGVFLPNETQDNAEMRALCLIRLGGRSRLCGNGRLGNGVSRLVGVDSNYNAEGAAREIDSDYLDPLQKMMEGELVLHTPKGDYVKIAGKLEEQE